MTRILNAMLVTDDLLLLSRGRRLVGPTLHIHLASGWSLRMLTEPKLVPTSVLPTMALGIRQPLQWSSMCSVSWLHLVNSKN